VNVDFFGSILGIGQGILKSVIPPHTVVGKWLNGDVQGGTQDLMRDIAGAAAAAKPSAPPPPAPAPALTAVAQGAQVGVVPTHHTPWAMVAGVGIACVFAYKALFD
jgi:hypothetical protein